MAVQVARAAALGLSAALLGAQGPAPVRSSSLAPQLRWFATARAMSNRPDLRNEAPADVTVGADQQSLHLPVLRSAGNDCHCGLMKPAKILIKPAKILIKPAKIQKIQNPLPRGLTRSQTPSPNFHRILIGKPCPDLQTRSCFVGKLPERGARPVTPTPSVPLVPLACSRHWRRNARRSSVSLEVGCATAASGAASGRARLGAKVACAVLRGGCPTAVERPALLHSRRQGRSPTISWEETRCIGLCSQAKPFAEGKDPGPDPAEIL